MFCKSRKQYELFCCASVGKCSTVPVKERQLIVKIYVLIINSFKDTAVPNIIQDLIENICNAWLDLIEMLESSMNLHSI